MAENTKRIAYWDNLKGILILLVVFGHFLWDSARYEMVIPTILIFAFHMPVFVYVSGYFSRNNKQDIVKFLLLYVLTNIALWAGYSDGLSSVWQPAFHTWYLLALIVWRFVTPVIASETWSLPLTFVIALVAGFCPFLDNTFCVSRILALYPFFLLGYQCRNGQFGFLEKRSVKIGLTATGIVAASVFGLLNIYHNSSDALLFFPYTAPRDVILRILMFAVACGMIVILRYITSSNHVCYLSDFGQYSLWIYIGHRFIVLSLRAFMEGISDNLLFAVISVVLSILICLVLGNRYVGGFLNRLMNRITTSMLLWQTHRKVWLGMICSVLVVGLVVGMIDLSTDGKQLVDGSSLLMMSEEMHQKYDDAFCITYVGDLILLEEQVQRGYKDGKYQFDDVFAHAKPYIENADLAIGVLEGPLAGNEVYDYSLSNYGDGKRVRLNYPDEFAQAIQNTGFDMVTIANNHSFDCGLTGFERTVDVLDEIGLDHVGAIMGDHERVELREYNGMKVAFVAYTYGLNFVSNERLFNAGYTDYIPIATYSCGLDYWRLCDQVEEDFAYAKSLDPDLIIALPHMGTQFMNEPDAVQTAWFQFLKHCGADIILGDHSHSVQPIVMEEYHDKSVLSVYSPGNFANRYREEQGDTSVLVNIYIDRDTHEVLGYGVVPLYTTASVDSNYTAIPIHDLVEGKSEISISADDMVRVEVALDICLDVIFDVKMQLYDVAKEYIYDGVAVYRWYDWKEYDNADGTLLHDIENAGSVCFVGDSLTDGMKNDGVGWYVPLVSHSNIKVDRLATGGWTTKDVISRLGNLPQDDMYVVAIGVNDIRYGSEEVGAITVESYIDNISKICIAIRNTNADAKIVCIAPWFSRENDMVATISYSEIVQKRKEYSEALAKYCVENGCSFIDGNEQLEKYVRNGFPNQYLLDWIHPNAVNGVPLYADVVNENYR